MTKDEAVKHFGSQEALAKALDMKQPSVAEWGEYPPETRQLQLHRITKGKLRAEPEVIEKFGEPRSSRAAA
jgi:hypothetical protein